MSNNHLLNKNLNQQIVANIFSSLVNSEKWNMLLEMFRLKILDINAQDFNGKNALYWAITKNKLESIKEFIALGIKTEVSPNFSAMNYAVYLDNTKILKCLKNCGLNINEIDDINSTQLIYALLYIENGADLEHEDFLGNSAKNLAHFLKNDYLIKKFQ